MKKTILVIFLLNSAIILLGQSPANDPHWQLVWEDNFNSLNTNIWKVQNNFDHYSGLVNNGEPQVYTNRSNNVSVSGGNLVLKIIEENYSCPSGALNDWGCSRQDRYGIPYQYTSGWVETKNPYKPKYGFIEARIKVPYGNGFWPAFWLFSDEIQNGTSYQEIDIFEMVPGRWEDCVYSNSLEFTHNYNHLTSSLHNVRSSNEPFCTSNFRVFSINDYRQWHKYGIEWSPSKIIYYVDDIPIRTVTNVGNFDPSVIILNVALNPFVTPYYSSNFPSEMLVDYVKVYNLNNDCNTVLNICNYDFTYHDTRVKKKIIIGNGTCTNSLNINDNVFLRASEGVEINGDFTVPVGAELYIDVNTCY